VLFDSEVAEKIMDKQCQYFDLPILFKIDQTLYFWKAVRFTEQVKAVLVVPRRLFGPGGKGRASKGSSVHPKNRCANEA
jgi:hypothetical protein